MRILQVIPVFSTVFGGPVKVVRSISKELAKNHDVTVYTTSAKDHKSDYKNSPFEVESDGYRVVYFPRILRSSEFNISPTMARSLKETLDEYDVIHVHSWRQFQDMVVHHYAVKRGIPYVLQAHGSIPRIMTKKRLKWLYDVLFGYRVLRDASKVISLSQTESEQYKSMRVPEEKIEVIPNGIDLSEYGDLPPKGSFKSKFSINPEEKIVLYLGRVHETKGLNVLADAFGIIAKKLDRVRLVIVGPDDGYTATFSGLISKLGIKERVLLTGFVEQRDKLAALVDSDLLVTPQFYGFPVTFLEACLACCPIITTFDSLGWVHNNVGYVVEGSPIALAKAISTVLQDDSTNKRFRDNCKHAIKDFDISVVTHRFEDTYEYVTGR